MTQQQVSHIQSFNAQPKAPADPKRQRGKHVEFLAYASGYDARCFGQDSRSTHSSTAYKNRHQLHESSGLMQQRGAGAFGWALSDLAPQREPTVIDTSVQRRRRLVASKQVANQNESSGQHEYEHSGTAGCTLALDTMDAGEGLDGVFGILEPRPCLLTIGFDGGDFLPSTQ